MIPIRLIKNAFPKCSLNLSEVCQTLPWNHLPACRATEISSPPSFPLPCPSLPHLFPYLLLIFLPFLVFPVSFPSFLLSLLLFFATLFTLSFHLSCLCLCTLLSLCSSFFKTLPSFFLVSWLSSLLFYLSPFVSILPASLEKKSVFLTFVFLSVSFS